MGNTPKLLIKHQPPPNDYVRFRAVGGSVYFSKIGTTYGDVIDGSLDVTLEGERQVCDDYACETTHNEVITGILRGKFKGVLWTGQVEQNQ